MASQSKRLAANVPGEFFVDSSCIDCDACRWIAPATFDRLDENSRVYSQPATSGERERAFEALIACPTGSIGVQTRTQTRAQSRAEIARARDAFPVQIDGDVYHCGWHAEASFGAASYLIRRDASRGGNILVDSPRFSSGLVKRLEQLGGVATMFLTHCDDVADHRRFAEHFACSRVIHRDDLGHGTRHVEVVIEGTEPRALDDGVLVIPTPGHTAGSTCLLIDERYLFTGDHLAFSPVRAHLYAFRDACWFDWHTQIESMRRLAEHDFEWVLPGHGRRAHFTREQMRVEMQRCVTWMQAR
jgi:glyoxylase-like metal-dependent hydrolase (beta-lactamase superfamily II)/ferredoxin